MQHPDSTPIIGGSVALSDGRIRDPRMMTTENTRGLRTFQASDADIPMGTPVILLNTGRIADSRTDVSRPVIGFAGMTIPANGYGTVELVARTFMMKVDGPTTVGEYVPMAGASPLWPFICLDAATAAGDLIEVISGEYCPFGCSLAYHS